MKKIVVSGLLTGLVMLVASLAFDWLFKMVFPGLNAEYQSPGLFRPWSDPIMSLYFLHPFAVGLILAWLWPKTKILFQPEKGCGGKCCSKELCFGFIWWVVSLPGMLISYASFPVSLTMVLGWTLGGLANSLLAGLVLEKLDK